MIPRILTAGISMASLSALSTNHVTHSHNPCSSHRKPAGYEYYKCPHSAVEEAKTKIKDLTGGHTEPGLGFTVAFYHCLLCSKTTCWMKEAQFLLHAAPGEGGFISGAAYFPQQRCMHDSSVARHDFVLLWDLLKEGLQ